MLRLLPRNRGLDMPDCGSMVILGLREEKECLRSMGQQRALPGSVVVPFLSLSVVRQILRTPT